MAVTITFDTTVEGFIGERYNGGVSEPELSWQSSGYPAGGSIIQDALDQNGTGASDRYFLNFIFGTYATTPIFIGDPSSLWFRISNRIAATRWFDIFISGGGFPTQTTIVCPPSGNTGWAKIEKISTVNDSQSSVQISCIPANAGPGTAYRWDGYYSIEVDNIYVGVADPTLPPIGVTAYQPSTGGIPWSIKVDAE